jgi:hypothetical protein
MTMVSRRAGTVTSVLGAAALALSTGCYAEITGGAYKVSQEGGTLPMGEGMAETAFSVGLAVGVQLDFWHKTRLAAGYSGTNALVSTEMDGSGSIGVGGLNVRLDQTLLSMGSKSVLGVSVSYASGDFGSTYTPSGAGSATEYGDGSSRELYAGATLGLYNNSDPAYSNWSYHLSAGAAYLTHDNPMGYGEVSLLGVQGRFTWSWGAHLIAGIGRGVSAPSEDREPKFFLQMDDTSAYVPAVSKAMSMYGCDVKLAEADRTGGFCSGVQIVVVQEGSTICVGCSVVTMDQCKALFADIIAKASN